MSQVSPDLDQLFLAKDLEKKKATLTLEVEVLKLKAQKMKLELECSHMQYLLDEQKELNEGKESTKKLRDALKEAKILPS